MSATSPGLDELASTLVKARTAMGITQNELHKRTGISREAIKGYETGRNKPGARELKLLSEALQVSPNLLLFGTESPFESKGELFDMLQSSGQLDWARLAALFLLLTAKEKASILFIIESIILGRCSHDEITKQVQAFEFMSAMIANMAQHGKKVEEGEIKEIDPEKFVQDVSEFMESRSQDLKKKPG